MYFDISLRINRLRGEPRHSGEVARLLINVSYECGPVRLRGSPHINRGMAQAPLMF